MRALGAGGAGGPSPSGTAPAAGAGSGGLAPPAAYDEHKWGTVRHLCGVAVYQEEEVGRRMESLEGFPAKSARAAAKCPLCYTSAPCAAQSIRDGLMVKQTLSSAVCASTGRRQ
jgi:hypothetical protein